MFRPKLCFFNFIAFIFVVLFLTTSISLWIQYQASTFSYPSTNTSQNEPLQDLLYEDLPPQNILKQMINCYDKIQKTTIKPHGNFWVLANYIPATKSYKCLESITYTTQGDYTFLDNLIVVAERWQGPISVALHVPGFDFQPTLDSIAYLRNCQQFIKEYVTFHLFFDMGHAPRKSSGKPFNLPLWQLYEDRFDCNKAPPYLYTTHKQLYKMKANISYPINVARNIARAKAPTYFVLASDIELYPSINLISNFFHMLASKPYVIEGKDPVIFVIPVFEVLEKAPKIKTELVKMVTQRKAFSFHSKICKRCHAIPQLEKWLNLKPEKELDVLSIVKRQGKYERWEAVYIGTNDDPFFDERLDWEKHGNKMSQAYALCLLNYDYMVLDNAFLVHKPGIKLKMINAEVIPITRKFLTNYLGIQLAAIYGKRKGCKA